MGALLYPNFKSMSINRISFSVWDWIAVFKGHFLVTSHYLPHRMRKIITWKYKTFL